MGDNDLDKANSDVPADAPEIPADGPAPLTVHVLFHPQSNSAGRLAAGLFRLLSGPSSDWGPRIPVVFGQSTEDGRPLYPDVRLGTRSLVVVLLDSRMARSASPSDRETAQAWAELVEELLGTYPPGSSTACSVLPVAVDAGGLTLSPHLDDRSFVRADTMGRRHLEFHVVIGCLRLMSGKPASEQGAVQQLPPSAVELFVSHAKRDLARKSWQGAVAALLRAHTSLPLKSWYDSSDIPVGDRFAEAIQEALDRASAVIVVLSDNYSSREWCRREVLAAKAAGRPIVVVDAIQSQVVRLFPYIGNAPTIRWRAALADASGLASQQLPGLRETWEDEDASTVLLVTLVEALRHEHEKARLAASAASSDIVLGTHPELITITASPRQSVRVLYPDPPLGREELHRIREARPDLELVTPMDELLRRRPRKGQDLIALSLSGSSDGRRYGGTSLHLATMAHDVPLFLLLGGFRLLYGGLLGYGANPRDIGDAGDDGEGDGEVDYVRNLMELVERHSPLASQMGRSLQPIENWVAWPSYKEMSDADRDLYRRDRAQLVEVRQPFDLRLSPGEFEYGSDGRYPTDTRAARYVRARSVTAMREESSEAASARVALGGKLDGYAGLMPGVAEEALLTLRLGKPLFLLGGFGGAARAVIDCLRGDARVEMTTAWCAEHVPGWRDLAAEYESRGHELMATEQLAAELRRRARNGLSNVLRNGLSDRDNTELAATTDAHRAVELIVRGLDVVGGGQS